MIITNPQMRRWLRKYVEHQRNGKDSRYVIDLFHRKIGCSKQRVSGNLSFLVVGQHRLRIITNIPGIQSDLFKI